MYIFINYAFSGDKMKMIPFSTNFLSLFFKKSPGLLG